MQVDFKTVILGAPHLQNDITGHRHLGAAKIGKHDRWAKQFLVVQAECSSPISTAVLVMGVAGFTFDLLREVTRLEIRGFIKNNGLPAISPCFSLECEVRCVLEVTFGTHCCTIKRRVIVAIDSELASGRSGTMDTAEVAAQAASPPYVHAVSDSGTGYYRTLVIMVHLSELKFNAKREVTKHTTTVITIVVNALLGA